MLTLSPKRIKMKIKAFFSILTLTALVLFSSCEEKTEYKDHLNDAALFREVEQKLSDVIVYDIFSPPIASRVHVYPSIAAYAIMQQAHPDKYQSLQGQLTDYTDVPALEDRKVIPNLAAVHAFLTVGKALIFSEEKIEDYQQQLYDQLQDEGLSSLEFKASIKYGEAVAEHILNWADGDFYKQTRTFPKYTIQEEDRYWKPTPPDYMEGIEPHWNKIRPMVLKSADQFPPVDPYPVTMDKDSPFYKELIEVYETGNMIAENKDSEEAQIASFWDCNPYVSHHKGHAMFATKKITPGGHWIGIVKIASELKNDSFDHTVNAYMMTSIALFDGFISCWDTKWNTLVVRPETLINQYIDEEWLPHLQTPPFPEYTSGHSVISRAAAIALTAVYGDNFEFLDTTERVYGLGDRSFKSFIDASNEAAMSRLYGGIHYRRACEEGVKQGEAVGTYIVKNLMTLK